MAEKKGVDPFEAFKAKKAEKEKQAIQQLAADDAAKKLGWIEGVGPADKTADPNRPKGFSRGRFAKTNVNPAELAKLKPHDYDATQLAKPKPTDVAKLAPEDKRRPKKFDKY
jgi:hypothetical protein